MEDANRLHLFWTIGPAPPPPPPPPVGICNRRPRMKHTFHRQSSEFVQLAFVVLFLSSFFSFHFISIFFHFVWLFLKFSAIYFGSSSGVFHPPSATSGHRLTSTRWMRLTDGKMIISSCFSGGKILKKICLIIFFFFGN